jgi:hypothetical protein
MFNPNPMPPKRYRPIDYVPSYPNILPDDVLRAQGAYLDKLRQPSGPEPFPEVNKVLKDCAESMKNGIQLCKYEVGAKVDESGVKECFEEKKEEFDECWQNTKDNVSDYVNDKWEKTTETAKHVMERGDEALLNSLPYTEKHHILSGRAKDEERREHERKLEEMHRQYPEFRLFVKHLGTGRTATLLVRGNQTFRDITNKLEDAEFPVFEKFVIPNYGQRFFSDIAEETIASKGIKNDTQIEVFQPYGRGGGTRKKRRGKRRKTARKRIATTRKRRRKGTRKKRYSK